MKKTCPFWLEKADYTYGEEGGRREDGGEKTEDEARS
jgi:hypothetical protein